jgi:hypothetical protein
MILELIAASAVIASVIAIAKHGSVSAALASAKREAISIEGLAVKVEADIKAELVAIAARLRAL